MAGPGLLRSLAAGDPGSRCDLGLSFSCVQLTLPAAGVPRPSWQGDLGTASLCPPQEVAAASAVDEVSEDLVLIFQEPAENWLVYLQ